ncbi:MAG: DUF2490 domain-containing protein [Candidatus Sericytochromatia bacterium]|nr:DUF2490 domain-containing protein [Candidatus Sericytochromatia bacterium]
MPIARHLARGTGLALACVALGATPARADTGYWHWTEARLPLTARAPGTGQPVVFRTFSDMRFFTGTPGLTMTFFRAGPLWTMAPWLVVGTQATAISLTGDPRFTQEYRAELEPTLLGGWGDFKIMDRNRLEYRMRFGSTSTAHFRYRNMLRINHAPAGAVWIPYVWNEPLVELGVDGFQNRLEAGVGCQLARDVRVDLGVMWRARQASGAWDQDVILNGYMYLAPEMKPIFD